MMLVMAKFHKIASGIFLFVLLACLETQANAATVQIVSEGSSLANAKLTEIERNGTTYIGQHLLGFVGDIVELGKGKHEISLNAPNDYLFGFSISVGDDKVTVSDVSIGQMNCRPELKAAWAGPKVTVSAKGMATVILPTPQFGPPTGQSWCTGPVIVACEKRKISLDIRSTPAGAEIWINDKRQPVRSNNLVETELELCSNTVDVLLRLPGLPNCNRKVALTASSISRVSCDFIGATGK